MKRGILFKTIPIKHEGTKARRHKELLVPWCLRAFVIVNYLWLNASAPAAAAPLTQQELLTNPGFEGVYVQQCCHTEPGFDPNSPYAEIAVAPGWRAWWVEPDSSPDFPGGCNYAATGESCQPYHRPEFRDLAVDPVRIHSGTNAQKYFTFYSTHQAGVYQQVSGVTVGQAYRFSAYMQAWSTNSEAPGAPSSGQPSMDMRVGIDPTGGTNPFSPNIVWSQQPSSFDAWALYSVEAIAQSATLTVYTRSHPTFAWRHNDIYLDDASLIAVSGGAAITQPQTSGSNTTPGAPPANVAPVNATPTWPPTSTPLPSGEVWYTVRPGNTLAVIAFYHGTTPDEIKRLNSLNSDIIFPGQQLLLGFAPTLPAVTEPPPATPTATPELVQLPTTGSAPVVALAAPTTAPAVLSPDYGQLCVVAYNDLNGNASNDNEPSLPEVRVTLSVGNTPLDGYVTTTETTHCFPQLSPGTYTVSVAAPPGYTATTTSESAVQLEAGKVITLVFGLTAVATAESVAPGIDPGLILFGAGIVAMIVALIGMVAVALRKK
jgi:LysM repeat protein